jgi:hypothetical protein
MSNIFFKQDADAVADVKFNYIYIGFILVGVIAGVLVGISHYAAIALAIGIGIVSVVARDPIRALACLIIISPFGGTTYLRESLLGVAGFKPLHIIALLIIVVSALNYAKSAITPKWVIYTICGIIGIFTISLFRSLQYLDLYNQHYYLKAKLSAQGYILSEYIKPLIYFLPFVVIIKFANTKERLEFIHKIIYATLIILSVHLLYTYITGVSDLRLELEDVTDYYSTYFGLHRNDLATFYIIGLPIAVGRLFFNKKFHDIIFNIIIITAIGILFSRAAYLTTIITILLYLVMIRRTSVLSMIIIGAVIISFGVSGAIISRATKGIESKNREVIFAGRVDSIWIPLFNESIKSPKKLIVGKCRYSILSSEAKERGNILKGIAHPHSMYLEMIMDAGLIGLIIFVAIYIKILASSLKLIRFLKDESLKESLYTNMISIICFLAAGFVGRSFFPKPDNILIWAVLACAIITCELSKNIELNKKTICL